MSSTKPSSAWSDIAATKRSELTASIPSEWRIPTELLPAEDQQDVTEFPKTSGFFTDKELDITSTPAIQLLEKVRKQTWTALEVAQAFCKKAAVAHQLLNCLSETLFPEALDTARRLDEHMKQTGKPMGPFHGLPISLKDNFQIRGKPSAVGFVSWVNDPATKNSVLVDLLTASGAILYVKTAVPVAMMVAETITHIHGRTYNPLNRKLTSGGSSGGESALIAFGGSVLGVGTDIGGSVRIPAACTGLFTLRPSFGRFPTGGSKSGLAGQEAVNSVNGPLARSIDEIELFAKTVVGAEPWLADPKCLPIPWRTVELRPNLRLGVMWHDGIVTPTPPVQRALKETVEKLRKAGHEIIEWAPTLHKELAQILAAFFLADGGKSVKKILDPVDEPFLPEMYVYRDAKEIGVYDLWQIQAKRAQYMSDYLARWRGAGIDAILCPTTPFASVEHGKFKHVGYTGVFNVLDYAATSFPCGFQADRQLDRATTSGEPLSDTDAAVRAEYNPDAIHGMPVSLQLVAQRLEEEKVVAMTRQLLSHLL